MSKFILTVNCPSGRGIVAAITTYLAECGCNITDSAQFDDVETGQFFLRLSFVNETGTSFNAIEGGFAEVAQAFDMTYDFHDPEKPTRCHVPGHERRGIPEFL